MTRPRVTIHNTVSIDGKVTGFPVDLGLHYAVAGFEIGRRCGSAPRTPAVDRARSARNGAG
jgi:hypothetical protein